MNTLEDKQALKSTCLPSWSKDNLLPVELLDLVQVSEDNGPLTTELDWYSVVVR